MNRWQTCNGRRQSKKLMSETLQRRDKELLAMSRPKLKAAVRLITGHTILGLICLNPAELPTLC